MTYKKIFIRSRFYVRPRELPLFVDLSSGTMGVINFFQSAKLTETIEKHFAIKGPNLEDPTKKREVGVDQTPADVDQTSE